jgi:hypothetical protein
MWKVIVLLLVSALSGCASGPVLKSGDSRADAFISKLKPNFPRVKWVFLDIQEDAAGETAGSWGSESCHISIDKKYLENRASDVELAFVLAHELAHCDSGHTAARRMFVDTNLFWDQEIEADKLALDATRKSGLGDVSVLAPADLPFFLRDSQRASNTHPAGDVRLNALRGISTDDVGLFAYNGKIVIGSSQ